MLQFDAPKQLATCVHYLLPFVPHNTHLTTKVHPMAHKTSFHVGKTLSSSDKHITSTESTIFPCSDYQMAFEYSTHDSLWSSPPVQHADDCIDPRLLDKTTVSTVATHAAETAELESTIDIQSRNDMLHPNDPYLGTIYNAATRGHSPTTNEAGSEASQWNLLGSSSTPADSAFPESG